MSYYTYLKHYSNPDDSTVLLIDEFDSYYLENYVKEVKALDGVK
jgi:hypothetical protein